MSKSFSRQVIIVVNGPGEISGWLYPLASVLKRELPHVKICVALAPCVFSSGAELNVVRARAYVDEACSVWDMIRLATVGRLPAGFSRELPGIVVHLGGESYFSWAIAKWLKQKCFAYVETPFPLQTRFEKVFFSGFEKIAKRSLPSNGEVIGELMLDATHMRCPERATRDRGEFLIGLYPGSRDYLVKYTLPFMSVAADLVAKTAPHVKWAVARADFLPLEFLRNLPDVNDGRPLEGQNLRFEDGPEGPALVTAAGTRIEIRDNANVLRDITIGLTIPGTNTAELAILGVPIVLILPTVWAETSPLPGIGGHLGHIPLVGRYIKRAAAHLFLRRLKFLAHPNRRANRMVVPELVGPIRASDVAEAVLKLAAQDLEPIAKDLQEIMGKTGATARFVEELQPYLAVGVEPVGSDTTMR